MQVTNNTGNWKHIIAFLILSVRKFAVGFTGIWCVFALNENLVFDTNHIMFCIFIGLLTTFIQ